ncbi:MAG TPA: hypothetical protein VNV66_17480 [Pilimelia sp.]|nr:hypothetical protein [Pilimelia sp.]
MRLRQLWGRALAARGREAELLAAALGDTAAALRAVAAGYADSDAAATRRLPRREP